MIALDRGVRRQVLLDLIAQSIINIGKSLTSIIVCISFPPGRGKEMVGITILTIPPRMKI